MVTEYIIIWGSFLFGGIGIPVIAFIWRYFLKKKSTQKRMMQSDIDFRLPFRCVSADVDLRIHDVQGAYATHYLKVQAISNRPHLTEIDDYFSSDGSVQLAEAKGISLIRTESDGSNSHRYIWELDEPVPEGSVFSYEIKRIIREGFNAENEFWGVRQYKQTRKLNFKITFPPGRPCRKYVGKTVYRNTSVIATTQPVKSFMNGIDVIQWALDDVNPEETNRIEWRW